MSQLVGCFLGPIPSIDSTIVGDDVNNNAGTTFMPTDSRQISSQSRARQSACPPAFRVPKSRRYFIAVYTAIRARRGLEGKCAPEDIYIDLGPGLSGLAGLAFLKPEPWALQSPVSGSARLDQARAWLGSACGPEPSPQHH
jgi:hypothetical protein